MSRAYSDSETVDRRPAPLAGGASLSFSRPASRSGWTVLLFAAAALVFLTVAVARRLAAGVGVWSLGGPIAWSAEVAGVGFWLGLALAASALAAGWRRLAREDESLAVARHATTVSLAAAACALLVGILHLGRAGLAHWLLPLPLRGELGPHWGSPIAWASLALVAWGALALIGAPRERPLSTRRAAAQAIAALLALALVGASSVAAPVGVARGLLLVLAFAAGAGVAGLAATLALAAFVGTELGRLAERLATAALVFGALRAAELLVAWGAGDPVAAARLAGPFSWALWLAVAGSVAAPQLTRLAGVRASRAALLGAALAAAAGTGFDRLAVLVASQAHGPLPATWRGWAPGGWDAALFAGCVGLFAALCAAAYSPQRGIDKFDREEPRRSATSGSPTPPEPEVT